MASRRGPPPPIPNRGASTPQPDKKYCKGTWDYTANEPGELSFKVGDIIQVITEDPSGWWIGELNGQKGQFPFNFTEIYVPSTPPPIVPRPSPRATTEPTTEVKATPAPVPVMGASDPMSELKKRLANRSTAAPGEIGPVKAESAAENSEPTFKFNLKHVDNNNQNSGPTRVAKETNNNNPRAVTMIEPKLKPSVTPRSPRTDNKAPSVSSTQELPDLRPPVQSKVTSATSDLKDLKPQRKAPTSIEKPVLKQVNQDEPILKPALKPISKPTINQENKTIEAEESKPALKPILKPISKPVTHDDPTTPSSSKPALKPVLKKADDKPTSPDSNDLNHNNHLTTPKKTTLKSGPSPQSVITSPSPSPSSSSSSVSLGPLGDYDQFCTVFDELFNESKKQSGDLPSNPILKRVNASLFGASFCSIKGAKYSVGDSLAPFCLFDSLNPFIHAVAFQELGKQKVSTIINKAKAIDGSKVSACSDHSTLILSSHIQTGDFVELFQKYFTSLLNADYDYDLPTYLHSQSNLDDLFAAAYYLSSQNSIGKNFSIHDLISKVLQLRSIRLNCEKAAEVAASLATLGENTSLINDENTKEFQSLLVDSSSGTLPTISSISGSFIIIIPNIGGIALYSPLLNNQNISSKSLAFYKSFTAKFSL